MITDNKRSILYVDDEYINLELFKINFRNNYNVFTANSGANALNLIDKNNIGIIISDLKMPGMSGLELIEKIKTKHPQSICMILSAYLMADTFSINHTNELVFKYINKPWNKSDLIAFIEEAFTKFDQA